MVPCYSTATCLNIDACVYDVTPHNVVGEIWFQDVEIGIHCNLKKTKKKKKNNGNFCRNIFNVGSSAVNSMRSSIRRMSRKPVGCNFLEARRWCRSTGSRCWRRKCHGSLDSVPENTNTSTKTVRTWEKFVFLLDERSIYLFIITVFI